jgi:hypothetical protein
MQTDATFNTNCLHLPLSVIVDITNTGKTFPLAFAFITSESAEAFESVNAQLAELVWYDCPPPRVVLGDQSKGLTAAMAVSQGRTDQGYRDGQILQLCEWHVAQNFKKRLLDSGNYTKERREELPRFIWDYIQSLDEMQLEERRGKLLAEFREPERLYLRVGNQSTTSTVLINMLTSIHVNVNPRDMLLGNQSIHGWGARGLICGLTWTLVMGMGTLIYFVNICYVSLRKH